MASNASSNTEQQTQKQGKAAEPERFAVKINPDTALYGHQFDKHFGLTAYERRLVTQEQYDKYSDKHNGYRIIIKD